MAKKQLEIPPIRSLRQAAHATTKRRSSGLPSVDRVLGGGVPVGRQLEIFGPESSGKTSFCLTAVAKAQQLGIQCAFCDAECTTDLEFAVKAFGVDPDKLWYERPESGEIGIGWIENTVNNGAKLIVCDSVAAMVPTAELEGRIEQQHIGTQARLMAKAMRKLNKLCEKSGATILWINQTRDKIGVMFGNPETTPGGRALKFFAAIRLRASKVKHGAGYGTRFYCVKNKTAIPHRKTTVPLLPEGGYDVSLDVLDCAVDLKVVKVAKGGYVYAGKKLGKQKKALEILDEDSKLCSSLLKDVRKAMKGEGDLSIE